MLRIIGGATGLIGQEIVNAWLNEGHTIIAVGRSKQKIQEIFSNKVQAITWTDLTSENIKGAELILNLAGANIGEKYWTENRKKELLSSRIDSTKQFAKLCAELGANAPVLFHASAVGIYPFGDEIYTEKFNLKEPKSFLSQIAYEWENATSTAEENNVKVIHLRFGVVLAKQGGALPKMALPFYFYLGGKIGSGQQWISWITIADIKRSIDFLLLHPEIHGAVNIVAPENIQQKDFAVTLGKILHKPSVMPFPAFMVKIIFGEMGEELLLSGQRAASQKLHDAGFEFSYPTLLKALEMVYNRHT